MSPILTIGDFCMEKKSSVNAVKKVRAVFALSKTPLLLSAVQAQTGLQAPEVSMALTYLLKRNELSRELIANPLGKGRTNLWSYTYISKAI